MCDMETNSLTISLDGSNSSDPDINFYTPFEEDSLLYDWTCISDDCNQITIEQSEFMNYDQASFIVSILLFTLGNCPCLSV